MNDTVKNVVFLTNLTADTTYDLSVSAFVASQGGLSSVFVFKGHCENYNERTGCIIILILKLTM